MFSTSQWKLNKNQVHSNVRSRSLFQCLSSPTVQTQLSILQIWVFSIKHMCVPFLQREMKNKEHLWCTNITSLLFSNLIKTKTQPKYFFIFLWNLSATVAWAVNSIFHIHKHKLTTCPNENESKMGGCFFLNNLASWCMSNAVLGR